MAPSRALQLICRAAAAAPPCAGPSQHLAGFQNAEATPANPIQAPPVRFVLPAETRDVAETKNVSNRLRSPKRNLLQRPQALRPARREMAGHPPFPLPFPPIASGRQVPPPAAPDADPAGGVT